MGFTGPFNLYGGPAIVVPCGFTASGLPIGLQIAAPSFEESRVLRAASVYQHRADWHTRVPDLE